MTITACATRCAAMSGERKDQERHILRHGCALLVDPRRSLPRDRQGRRLDRLAALQRRPVRPRPHPASHPSPPRRCGHGQRDRRAVVRAEHREGRRYINYRDLSVQQLGSIYERLLEHEVIRDGRRDRNPPQHFRPQGFGQLLHARRPRDAHRPRDDRPARRRSAWKLSARKVRGTGDQHQAAKISASAP